MEKAITIVGCGDIGRRTAALLLQQGAEPTGVVSSAQSASALAEAGIAARVCDLDHQAPAVSATVLWLAPPQREGVQERRLQRFVAGSARPSTFLYLSTSGVYGDCNGAWIDEDAAVAPKTDRARRRADAERQLADWAETTGADLKIVRVPGIYGPGRLPEARLRQGLPLLEAAAAPYTNRIHADDLAAAIVHVLRHGQSGGVWNIADGHPTTMTDYFLRCAALLGIPPPPLVNREAARRAMSPAMWSFMEESKRLRVDRLGALGFRWRYPDLDSGLPACVPA